MKRVLFLDESGDLGYGKGASSYFVVAYVSVADKTNLYRTVRDIKNSLGIRGGELKAHGLAWEGRRKALERLAKVDMSIHAVVVNKANVYPRLRTNENVLYNYAAHFPLLDHIRADSLTDITLMADQRTTRVIGGGHEFDHYLRVKIMAEEGIDATLNCNHVNSANCLGVQAADLVANTIARKYERGHARGYNILSRLIAYEKRIFFD